MSKSGSGCCPAKGFPVVFASTLGSCVRACVRACVWESVRACNRQHRWSRLDPIAASARHYVTSEVDCRNAAVKSWGLRWIARLLQFGRKYPFPFVFRSSSKKNVQIWMTVEQNSKAQRCTYSCPQILVTTTVKPTTNRNVCIKTVRLNLASALKATVLGQRISNVGSTRSYIRQWTRYCARSSQSWVGLRRLSSSSEHCPTPEPDLAGERPGYQMWVVTSWKTVKALGLRKCIIDCQ